MNKQDISKDMTEAPLIQPEDSKGEYYYKPTQSIRKEGDESRFAPPKASKTGKKKRRKSTKLTGSSVDVENEGLLNGEKPLTVQHLNYMF